jgi:hypothetical protein
MIKHLLLPLALVLPAVAHAEELVGVVRAAGSGLNAHTRLAPAGESAGPSLCVNDVEKKVRRLGAMTVKANGDWREPKNKNGDKCFVATDFAVVKASSGRDAVVGTLSQKGGVYLVTGDDGKTHALGDVPGGLKKLDGQKVILDIKPIDSPSAKEAVYKVVTYSAHP